MKKVNNFDFSSTGVNIELSIYKSSDLSQFYFSENFKKIGERKFLFCDWGNIDYDVDLIDSVPDLYKEEILPEYFDKVSTIIIDTLGKDTFDYEMDGVKEELKGSTLYWLFESLDEYYMKEYLHMFVKVFDFKEIELSGYCQGDYCTIFVPDECTCSSDYLKKLIYDSPLTMELTINNEDSYLEEFGIDEYCDDFEEVKRVVCTTLKKEKYSDTVITEVSKLFDEIGGFEYE